MKMGKFGQIAVIIGLIAVLYGLILSVGIIPAGWFLSITAGGAFNGAITFFLMGIAFFLWPKEAGGGVE